MENVATILRRRRSCRDFSERALEREEIVGLVNDAVWVPNGSNHQPWRFVVLTDKKTLRGYSDIAKRMWLEHLAEAPYMQAYEATFRDPEANIFYNAPAVVIVYGNSNSYWYSYDCSMVAGNIHLLAEERGLGCCWIGEAHNVFADPAVMGELGVPQEYRLVAPLVLGHPARPGHGAENPNKRKPFEILFR